MSPPAATPPAVTTPQRPIMVVIPPPADAPALPALSPAAAVTTPQRPMVVTTMHPPMTPTTPSTSPNPTEEVFFEVGSILPGWKQVFILESLPTILGNKTFFKHAAKKDEPIKEGVHALKPMCVRLQLPRTGSKTVLIQRLVGCYFTNFDKFESDFEGTHDKFQVHRQHWNRSRNRQQKKKTCFGNKAVAFVTVASSGLA
jgi:hypothetical protein